MIIIVILIIIIFTWELARPTLVSMIPDNTITIERILDEEPELTGMALLEVSTRAVEAGNECRVNEAKKMRLEDIAEEAKELQDGLK